jgi:hypothetical protein
MLREMARAAQPNAALVLVVVPPCAPDHWFRLRYRYQPLPPARIVDSMAAAGWEGVQQFTLAGVARPFGRAYVGRKSFSAKMPSS